MDLIFLVSNSMKKDESSSNYFCVLPVLPYYSIEKDFGQNDKRGHRPWALSHRSCPNSIDATFCRTARARFLEPWARALLKSERQRRRCWPPSALCNLCRRLILTSSKGNTSCTKHPWPFCLSLFEILFVHRWVNIFMAKKYSALGWSFVVHFYVRRHLRRLRNFSKKF